ncbi:MAG: rhodanese-like domain-containing protein [Chloroflexi bacterium]|nr:rhodanese-like domain-containing protein [Chloroflexota bacterium]
MKRSPILLLLLLLMALALVACGGQDASQAPAAADVDLSALPDTLTPQQVNEIRNHPNVVLIDVREPWEYNEGHIPGVTLIPLGTLPNRINEIPKDKTVIMTCRSGNRSGQAYRFLREQGFDNVHNMEGGILAWEKLGYEIER